MIAACVYVALGLLLVIPALGWVTRDGIALWPERWTPFDVFGAVACLLSVVGFMALLWPLGLAVAAWEQLERRGKVPPMGGLAESAVAIIGATLGAVGFVVLLWPVLLALIVWALLARKDDGPKEEHFTVPETSLEGELSVEEIERRELVDDPLGGAPRLPFGHLNPVWRTLLESVTPQSTIWSFSTVWETSGGSEQVEGYVVRTGDVIGPHMVSSRRWGPKKIDLVNPPRKQNVWRGRQARIPRGAATLNSIKSIPSYNQSDAI
jgi:hypothetical protein